MFWEIPQKWFTGRQNPSGRRRFESLNFTFKTSYDIQMRPIQWINNAPRMEKHRMKKYTKHNFEFIYYVPGAISYRNEIIYHKNKHNIFRLYLTVQYRYYLH